MILHKQTSQNGTDIAEIFSEVIIAPDFAPGALDILRKKKNLRLMRLKGAPAKATRDVR
ncbi:MAG: hypothetical protein ACKOFH_01160, partial [Chthoniobacterales bacterium]